MAMRDYDRERENRGMNGLYGRDQQWQDDGSSSSEWNNRGGEWSTRPRYGYGESDRGSLGGSGYDRSRGSYGQSDFGQGQGQGQGAGYGRGSYGQGYGQSYYGQGSYGRDDYGMYGRSGGGRGMMDWDERSRGRDEPGMWDRFKHEMREGWDRMRGEHDQRDPYGRNYDENRFRGRGDRDEGLWDETKREMREGWDKVKETFRGKGPKGYARSDERIREDVCDRLAWHREVDASNIEISVKDGDVELSGTVEDRRQKRLAEDVVEDIFGVKDVSNRIRVVRQTQQQLGGTSNLGSTTSTSGQLGQQGTARPTVR